MITLTRTTTPIDADQPVPYALTPAGAAVGHPGVTPITPAAASVLDRQLAAIATARAYAATLTDPAERAEVLALCARAERGAYLGAGYDR